MHSHFALVCALGYITLTSAQDGPRATVTNDPNPVTTISPVDTTSTSISVTGAASTTTNDLVGATTGVDVAESALESYAYSLLSDSRVVSAAQVLATAVPQNVLNSLSADITKGTMTDNPFTAAWFTKLPKDVTSVIGSVWRQEATIIASALGEPVPAAFTTMYPEAGAKANGGAKEVLIGGAVVGLAGLVGAAMVLL